MNETKHTTNQQPQPGSPNFVTRGHFLQSAAALATLAAAMTSGLWPLSAWSQEVSAGAIATEQTTMLFFDDEPLFARDHVERRLGQPKRVGAYHETVGNCTWGYPAVFRMPDGKWRMVYNSGIGKSNGGAGCVLVAESDDGLAWKPLDTRGSAKIDDKLRRCPHQVLPNGAGSVILMSSAFEDPHAPADERYKLLSIGPARLWTSANLIDWKLKENIDWQAEAPDPPSFAFWNPLRKAYSIATRPDDGDRRIALVETKDWGTFTRPELVMQADADDAPLAQLYGMYALPYEGYFVGCLWIFHANDADRLESPPHLYLNGRQNTQLTYSLNGWHWQRCLHAPLFKNGAAGEPDAGCLQVSCIVPVDEKTLRCYASTSTREHGNCPPEDGYTSIYELRRDGFVSLDAGTETGKVITRALYWRGGELRLNLATEATGTARVAIRTARGKPIEGFTFDDCKSFHGDSVGWTPKWSGDHSMQQLAGQAIRVEIEMNSAKLYALRGDFTLIRRADVKKLEQDKTPPVRRPGF